MSWLIIFSYIWVIFFYIHVPYPFSYGLLNLLSVQFSRSVESNSLRPHETQHTRPPCPSPTPGIHPNSCASSRSCHPAISSCRPLLLLPPIPPIIRVFSNESTLCMRWPKYWSFSLTISPSNEHPGVIHICPNPLNIQHQEWTLR